ncbi:hypothetical protein LTR37_006478 [Vermiconidia calcicola]|uniref:Uncharacterized protein n=1 Tax=Vermiconidia calcicola TaxID=1690605 RepID=A0ACC3NGG7_9PEZI|nr:hypothetical protein LTR37_006478 [Vermiconidia calcicola]
MAGRPRPKNSSDILIGWVGSCYQADLAAEGRRGLQKAAYIFKRVVDKSRLDLLRKVTILLSAHETRAKSLNHLAPGSLGQRSMWLSKANREVVRENRSSDAGREEVVTVLTVHSA